ncbi:MAG: RES family NAD+ phosphorylase [Leeuwenhoekiella sp.]
MQVFRLSKKKYAGTLSGKGAALMGARWNPKGVEMIYTSESRALCLAEVLVHLPLTKLKWDYVLLTIEIPDELDPEEIYQNTLPPQWKDFPLNQIITQRLGMDFVKRNKSLLLKVPSAVVDGDFNYLINPAHDQFERVQVKERKDFPLDNRLF